MHPRAVAYLNTKIHRCAFFHIARSEEPHACRKRGKAEPTSSELLFYRRLSSDNAEAYSGRHNASDVREVRMKSGQTGLAAGSFVLNRITGVHAYVMVVYRDAPYIKVLRVPEDAPESAPWQTWPVHEAERILKKRESIC